MDYNLDELMNRYKKAKQYFERTDITTEEKLKHLDRLIELVKACGKATEGMSENKIREMME